MSQRALRLLPFLPLSLLLLLLLLLLLRLSVTLPDAEVGKVGLGGRWGFRAPLGTGPRKSHSMQNTSVMSCVRTCNCVQGRGWEGRGCLGVYVYCTLYLHLRTNKHATSL